MEICALNTAVTAMDLSPDHSRVAVAGRQVLKVLDINMQPGVLEPGQSRFTEFRNLRSGGSAAAGHVSFVETTAIKFNPHQSDAHRIATASSSGVVIIWNLQGNDHVVLREHSVSVQSLAWHPSEPYSLISGSQDGHIVLWDLRAGQTSITTFISHTSSVWTLQFNPIDRHIFAGGFDGGIIQVWDTRHNKKPLQHIAGHGTPVCSLDWHPQHQHILASAGFTDHRLRVWAVWSLAKTPPKQPETAANNVADVVDDIAAESDITDATAQTGTASLSTTTATATGTDSERATTNVVKHSHSHATLSSARGSTTTTASSASTTTNNNSNNSTTDVSNAPTTTASTSDDQTKSEDPSLPASSTATAVSTSTTTNSAQSNSQARTTTTPSVVPTPKAYTRLYDLRVPSDQIRFCSWRPGFETQIATACTKQQDFLLWDLNRPHVPLVASRPHKVAGFRWMAMPATVDRIPTRSSAKRQRAIASVRAKTAMENALTVALRNALGSRDGDGRVGKEADGSIQCATRERGSILSSGDHSMMASPEFPHHSTILTANPFTVSDDEDEDVNDIDNSNDSNDDDSTMSSNSNDSSNDALDQALNQILTFSKNGKLKLDSLVSFSMPLADHKGLALSLSPLGSLACLYDTMGVEDTAGAIRHRHSNQNGKDSALASATATTAMPMRAPTKRAKNMVRLFHSKDVPEVSDFIGPPEKQQQQQIEEGEQQQQDPGRPSDVKLFPQLSIAKSVVQPTHASQVFAFDAERFKYLALNYMYNQSVPQNKNDGSGVKASGSNSNPNLSFKAVAVVCNHNATVAALASSTDLCQLWLTLKLLLDPHDDVNAVTKVQNPESAQSEFVSAERTEHDSRRPEVDVDVEYDQNDMNMHMHAGLESVNVVRFGHGVGLESNANRVMAANKAIINIRPHNMINNNNGIHSVSGIQQQQVGHKSLISRYFANENMGRGVNDNDAFDYSGIDGDKPSLSRAPNLHQRIYPLRHNQLRRAVSYSPGRHTRRGGGSSGRAPFVSGGGSGKAIGEGHIRSNSVKTWDGRVESEFAGGAVVEHPLRQQQHQHLGARHLRRHESEGGGGSGSGVGQRIHGKGGGGRQSSHNRGFTTAGFQTAASPVASSTRGTNSSLVDALVSPTRTRNNNNNSDNRLFASLSLSPQHTLRSSTATTRNRPGSGSFSERLHAPSDNIARFTQASPRANMSMFNEKEKFILTNEIRGDKLSKNKNVTRDGSGRMMVIPTTTNSRSGFGQPRTGMINSSTTRIGTSPGLASTSSSVGVNPLVGSLGSAGSYQQQQHAQALDTAVTTSTSPVVYGMDMQIHSRMHRVLHHHKPTMPVSSPLDGWQNSDQQQQQEEVQQEEEPHELGLWSTRGLKFLSSMEHVWPLPTNKFEILNPYKQHADAVELQAALRQRKTPGMSRAAVPGAGLGFGLGPGLSLGIDEDFDHNMGISGGRLGMRLDLDLNGGRSSVAGASYKPSAASLVPSDMCNLLSPIVHEILALHSDLGDVQTCATLALCMEGKVQPPICQRKKLRWIDAYVSLLHRLRLFSVAALVMSSCGKEDSALLKSRVPAAEAKHRVLVKKCKKNERMMPEPDLSSDRCGNCQQWISQCSVCLERVSGHFAWCQGCGHGGHLSHLNRWFSKHTECPTGCGHKCSLAVRSVEPV